MRLSNILYLIKKLTLQKCSLQKDVEWLFKRQYSPKTCLTQWKSSLSHRWLPHWWAHNLKDFSPQLIWLRSLLKNLTRLSRVKSNTSKKIIPNWKILRLSWMNLDSCSRRQTQDFKCHSIKKSVIRKSRLFSMQGKY